MKTLRFLKSLRFTIVIMVCLLIVFLAGVIIPQKSLLGPNEYLAWKTRASGLVKMLELFGLTNIYLSPLTITLWTLFFLNLVLIMSSRIPVVFKKVFQTPDILKIDHPEDRSSYFSVDDSFERTIEDLRKGGYRVYVRGDTCVAIKNRYSPLGTIVFHLSFLLFLLGALIDFYTSFRAYADVAVGEVFRGEYDVIKKPLIGHMPECSFAVLSVRPEYYKGVIPIGLEITVLDEYGEKNIGINRPYKRDGVSYVIKKIDVAPLFILQDVKGQEIDGAFVRLNVLQGQRDSFEIGGYRFRVSFFTDYGREDERVDKQNLPQILKTPSPLKTSQTLEIRRPAFEISAFKGSDLVNKKIIFSGEGIEFDGKKLVFADLRYWVRFYVVGGRGSGIIYTGFVSIIVALIVRFVFPRKEVYGMRMHGKAFIKIKNAI